MRLLCETGAPSGYEHFLHEKIQGEMPEGMKYQVDAMNNLLVFLPTMDPQKPTLLLDCHADEVGFLVKDITPSGLIKLSPLGGWVSACVVGAPFWVGTSKKDWTLGIVGATPPHLLSPEARNQMPSLDSLSLDIGARSRAEVQDIFGVEIGSPVVPHAPFEYKPKTDTVFAKALDNRLGCALAMELLYEFREMPLSFNIVGCFSAQEELGSRGVRTATTRLNPWESLVLESSPADDIDNPHAQTYLGQGPQIRFKDANFLASPAIISQARNIARESRIPHQVIVKDAGGTNAGAITMQNRGIPTLVLSVPTRYIHSHVGICRWSDYQHTLDLAKLWINSRTTSH